MIVYKNNALNINVQRCSSSSRPIESTRMANNVDGIVYGEYVSIYMNIPRDPFQARKFTREPRK